AAKAASANSLMGQPLAHERGGAGGRRRRPGSRAGRRRLGRRRFQPERNREVPPTRTASERRGSVGETWFPPRERGKACRQRRRAKPGGAPQPWGERLHTRSTARCPRATKSPPGRTSSTRMTSAKTAESR